jgi:group II intron reverse transcriptase/maturase
MHNAETTLAIIAERGKRGLLLEDVYRRLYNPDLYLQAYGRIYRNDGALTRGVTDETVDGMSQEKIGKIIELLRNERYRWNPARRTYIPKKDGKQRPLGMPTWSDKLLQEVMRSILDAYFEPQFSIHSHGFRPGRGCHTALREIFCAWRGTRWFIEGDIKGFFDNIDHTIMLSILGEKIRDNRFLVLVKNLLKAGYLEKDWSFRPTLSGTPQGGIISPILANIYLDKFDKFVEQTLIPEYTRGKLRRKVPEYRRIESKIRRLKTKGATEATLKPLRKEMRGLHSKDPMDPDYRRLRYIRYADDFLIGFNGPREEAEEIKARMGEFLRDHLKLELSPEKTLITHAGTEQAQFLGYGITSKGNPAKSEAQLKLRLPIQKLKEKTARYKQDGKPIHRPELLSESDFAIVEQYGAEYRGIVQYYALATNRHWLNHLHWVMRTSLLKTLAVKHKTSVSKMAVRYAAEFYHRGQTNKCLEVIQEREGREPLTARFGGLTLSPEPAWLIADMSLDQDRMYNKRSELLARLLANECTFCQSRVNIEVHHVRKLADLRVKGRKEKPDWMKVMSSRKRKTLVVCRECHEAIHAGRPTRKPESQEARQGAK